ncbi:MAG: hypothetical protein Q8Q02_09190 [Nocardioides sp.]|nr:hypothetical protein [Nocardioides sp.]
MDDTTEYLIAVVEHALYAKQPATEETRSARALWERVCEERGWN